MSYQVSRLGDALETKKAIKDSARRTRCGRAPRRTFPGQLTCPGTYVPKVLMYSMWVGKYPPPTVSPWLEAAPGADDLAPSIAEAQWASFRQPDLRLATCLSVTSQANPCPKMISNAALRMSHMRLASQARLFSSSAARSAAQVNKLGVIGAGQMVSRSWHVKLPGAAAKLTPHHRARVSLSWLPRKQAFLSGSSIPPRPLWTRAWPLPVRNPRPAW